MDTLPDLNREQLELLSKPHNLVLIGTFENPLSVAEAAKKLKLPPTTLHYRVKQLLEANLLKPVGRNGRSALYQAAERRFQVPPALALELKEGNLKAVREHLNRLEDRLSKVVASGTSPHQGSVDENMSTISANAEDAQDLASRGPFPAVITFSDIKLTEAQHLELCETVGNMLDKFQEAQAGEGRQPCFVTFVAFKGTAKDFSSNSRFRFILDQTGS